MGEGSVMTISELVNLLNASNPMKYFSEIFAAILCFLVVVIVSGRFFYCLKTSMTTAKTKTKKNDDLL